MAGDRRGALWQGVRGGRRGGGVRGGRVGYFAPWEYRERERGHTQNYPIGRNNVY